jgi:hypothetical protein
LVVSVLLLFGHQNLCIFNFLENDVHTMKSNPIVKFIHLLQVFIAIQLLIKVVWGASVWEAYINLLIRGAKVKGQNYFTKTR